ncbi:MAG TPA: hypothetical protein VII28_01325 [Puia sp.]
MVNAFRYVVDDRLYTAFSQLLRLQNGKKVFEINCPDFVDNGFEIIETGMYGSPYQPTEPNFLDPFSQTLTQWFSDFKLLSDEQ